MNSVNARNGLIAGLTATVVLSLLMILKAAMGLMPAVNAIQMLAHIGAVYLHTPAVPILGWIAHFAIGTVLWGLVFSATHGAWPGAAAVKGIAFSIVAWLLMMLIVMPLAGAGLFGLRIGPPAAVATLVLHIVYGAVLGIVYAKLTAGQRSQEHARA